MIGKDMVEATIKENLYQTAVLADSPESIQNILSVLREADLDHYLDLRPVNTGEECPVGCEMAIVFIQQSEFLEGFIQILAYLKVVSKIPSVLAVVQGDCYDQLQTRLSEVAADKILHLPLSPHELAKIIKTCAATVRIRKVNSLTGAKAGQSPQSLGMVLVENGIITPVQLKKALDNQKKMDKPVPLGQVLVTLGYIDEFQMTHFLASQMGFPMATPKQYASADLNVVSLIPDFIARENLCIALEKENQDLIVAMLDVTNLKLLDSLRDLTECNIKPILGTQDEIKISIERYYADISSHNDASELMADLGHDIEFLKGTPEDFDSANAIVEGAEQGIIKLVNMFISNAVRDRASDIHIEPMESHLSVRYRIDGELRKLMAPPKNSHSAIVTRIKILSNLDIAERRLPQDGRMVVRMGQREVDIRVSILPTVYGEKVVLRILDKEAFKRSMNNLGFSSHELKIFKTHIAKPYGMIIVTGPTGSGKSTTLYSALEQVKDVATNIVSVEDPVEFHIEGVSQVHVNSAIGLTFASALRSILRQDPDIILIGEIRDHETADIAVKMSLTGHLVFSTLHTNDAASAITRFVDIGIAPLLLNSSLNLIIAQRLVRRICDRCKVEYAPDPDLIRQLELDPGDSKVRFFRGAGCVSCHGTGHLGRIGIYEMMVVSKEIKSLILKNATQAQLHDQAIKEGMRTLRKAGVELVLKSITTIEEVVATTTEN